MVAGEFRVNPTLELRLPNHAGRRYDIADASQVIAQLCSGHFFEFRTAARKFATLGHMLWKPNIEIITTALEDESVLLNPRTQELFTLNSTGKFVWDALQTRPSAEIPALLAQTFEVDEATATADTVEIFKALSKAGLVYADA
jgi:hypothetical protein